MARTYLNEAILLVHWQIYTNLYGKSRSSNERMDLHRLVRLLHVLDILLGELDIDSACNDLSAKLKTAIPVNLPRRSFIFSIDVVPMTGAVTTKTSSENRTTVAQYYSPSLLITQARATCAMVALCFLEISLTLFMFKQKAQTKTRCSPLCDLSVSGPEGKVMVGSHLIALLAECLDLLSGWTSQRSTSEWGPWDGANVEVLHNR